MATKSMARAKAPASSTTPEATVEKTVASENSEKAAKKKEFKDHDGIPCVSCTVGELLVQGARSKILYRWSGLGDKANVEYYDLMAMLHSRSPYMFKPRFIVQDKNFLAENPQLNKLYDSLYTIDDFRDVLKMPASSMIETIKKLPVGAQDAIKGLAAGMIDSGEMDSISTIKALDAFYGTNMLLKLAQNA